MPHPHDTPHFLPFIPGGVRVDPEPFAHPLPNRPNRPNKQKEHDMDIPLNDDFRATEEGYPVSGDKLRVHTFDDHPTQPFRFGDVLWPLLAGVAS